MYRFQTTEHDSRTGRSERFVALEFPTYDEAVEYFTKALTGAVQSSNQFGTLSFAKVHSEKDVLEGNTLTDAGTGFKRVAEFQTRLEVSVLPEVITYTSLLAYKG